LLLGPLAGCQSGGATSGSVTATNGVAQLTFLQFPQLATVGDGVVVDSPQGPIVVVRTGDATATALSAVCTHAGCTVGYTTNQPPIFCPCHGSEFAISGQVVAGPARSPLRTWPATVDANGVNVMLG
jgi:cytochrome b6-f complex iron-sulfur subunit